MSAMILIVNYEPSAAQVQSPAELWRDTATHIASLDGLRWKYWLRGADDAPCGGVYLFDTSSQARAGGDLMEKSLVGAGAKHVRLQFFKVDAELSALTRGTIAEPA